jgi:hypothetical protein
MDSFQDQQDVDFYQNSSLIAYTLNISKDLWREVGFVSDNSFITQLYSLEFRIDTVQRKRRSSKGKEYTVGQRHNELERAQNSVDLILINRLADGDDSWSLPLFEPAFRGLPGT